MTHRLSGRVDGASGLGGGDHICWTYATDLGFLQPAFEYLEDGLRLGQRLAYTADAPVEQLREHMAPLGGVDDLIRERTLLLVPLSDMYDLADPGGPERQLAAYAGVLRQALADGYTGLRVVADVTPLVKDPARRPAHARWEHVADRWMARGNPMTAFCAYDRRAATGEGAASVACLHPLVHAPEDVAPFQMFADRGRIAVTGEVDYFTVSLLRSTLSHATATADGDCVVDLSRLGFIEHTGLSALAEHGRRLARLGMALRVSGASEAVRRMCGLFQITDVHLVDPPDPSSDPALSPA